MPSARLFSTKVKHSIPRKTATSTMAAIKAEQLATPLPWPAFRAGDALEVKMLPYKTAEKPVIIRGVVISKVNRGYDSSFVLKDVFLGEIVERRISLYAPLIQDLKVVQKAFIHRNRTVPKRVRRSKLYYLRDLDPLICKVS